MSELDILKEAERLWADGLAKAVENRDAVGVVKNNSGERYSIKEGVNDEERFNELKDKTLNTVGYNPELYVSQLLAKIKETELYGQSMPLAGGESSPLSVSNISLPRLLGLVKDEALKDGVKLLWSF